MWKIETFISFRINWWTWLKNLKIISLVNWIECLGILILDSLVTLLEDMNNFHFMTSSQPTQLLENNGFSTFLHFLLLFCYCFNHFLHSSTHLYRNIDVMFFSLHLHKTNMKINNFHFTRSSFLNVFIENEI